MARKRTALVTGAEGFIGSHLAMFLHKKKWDVVATSICRTERKTFQSCPG